MGIFFILKLLYLTGPNLISQKIRIEFTLHILLAGLALGIVINQNTKHSVIRLSLGLSKFQGL